MSITYYQSCQFYHLMFFMEWNLVTSNQGSVEAPDSCRIIRSQSLAMARPPLPSPSSLSVSSLLCDYCWAHVRSTCHNKGKITSRGQGRGPFFVENRLLKLDGVAPLTNPPPTNFTTMPSRLICQDRNLCLRRNF